MSFHCRNYPSLFLFLPFLFSGSVAPRQLTDVAKSKRTFERNQFRHAKVTPLSSIQSALQRIYRFFLLFCVSLVVLHVSLFSIRLRVERATDDTMPNSSSISTLARALWVPVPSADRADCFFSLFFWSLSLSAVPYLLCSTISYRWQILSQ
jgi:hypothetical protein